VEIEPGVLEVRVSQLVIDMRECISNAQLIALPIDQIDPILLSVGLLCLLDVFLGSVERFVEVRVDRNARLPSQVGLHLPRQRDRPTDLHVCVHFQAVVSLRRNENVLSFDEIGRVSVTVKASGDKATTWPAAILTRDQVESQLIIDLSLLVKPIHDRGAIGSELGSFEVAEEVVVESEVRDVVDAVGPQIVLFL